MILFWPFRGNSHEGLKLKADAPTLLSADMRRELLRQKWEQEMEQTQNGPVHYSNVQFDGEFKINLMFIEIELI